MTDPISEGRFLDVNGEPQWVTLMGADRANPALLVLPGAGAGFSAFAPLFRAWEADFTVVHWDQPGAGWTLARNGPPPALSYFRLVRDGLEVVRQVLARLGQEELVLLCLSGGSVTGLRMVAARPDLFCAYVAQGQVTHWGRMEAESYRMVLDRARAAGDAEGVRQLEEVGPPPWDDPAKDALRGLRANALTPSERATLASPAMAEVTRPRPSAPWVAPGLERPDGQAAGLAAWAQIKPQLARFDARELGDAFELPMLFIQGAEDAHTPTAQVAAWVEGLTAPSVRLEVLEGAGHSAIFLVDRIGELLRAEVLPLTSGRRTPSPADR